METFPPTSDSSRAAVGGRQKDGHLVLVNGLEAYKSGNSVVRGTNRLQNDLNCVDGDVKPQQKQTNHCEIILFHRIIHMSVKYKWVQNKQNKGTK